MNAITEEVAAKKWCPFARVQVGIDGSGYAALAGVNRTFDENPYHGSRCIASACMAWQFVVDNEGRSGLPLGTCRAFHKE